MVDISAYKIIVMNNGCSYIGFTVNSDDDNAKIVAYFELVMNEIRKKIYYHRTLQTI